MLAGIVNQSSFASATIAAHLPTYQKFLDTVVAPVYPEAAATISFLGDRLPAVVPDVSVMLVDTMPTIPGVGGDIGFHTSPDGKHAVAYVIVPAVLADGDDVDATIMHELIESLIDPSARATVTGPNGYLYMKEAADPVQGMFVPTDRLLMPNIVLPSYWAGGVLPFDLRGVLDRSCPCAIGGGYQYYWNGAIWTGLYGFRGIGLTARQIYLGRGAYRRQFHPLTGARL